MYWSDGAQIIPPIDAYRQRAIEAAARTAAAPQPGLGGIDTRRLLLDRYLADTLDQAAPPVTPNSAWSPPPFTAWEGPRWFS